MSDLSNYIRNRKKTDPKFSENFDEGYLDFKIGVTIKTLRKDAKLTQEELATMLHTKKSYISRIENQAEDICLTKELHRHIALLAAQEDTSINAYIKHALEQYINYKGGSVGDTSHN